jgi:hypothetical protein
MNARNQIGIWVDGCGKAAKNMNMHGSKELKTSIMMLYQQRHKPHKTQTQQNESVNEITGTMGDRTRKQFFWLFLWSVGNE